MGIPAFIIAAARFIGTKQGIAFAQKIIGAGVVAVEAKGAAKAIAVKGDELQQEIATGKNGSIRVSQRYFGAFRGFSWMI